jgi:hypothetical protein
MKKRKISASSSDNITISKNLEYWTKLLGCNVCMEIISGKLLQCNNGHLLCSNCRKSISGDNSDEYICPVCKTSTEPARNLALEDLTQDVIFKCKNSGCDVASKRQDMKKHENTCKFQAFSCPFSNTCAWESKVTEVENIFSHCDRHRGPMTSIDIVSGAELDKFMPWLIIGKAATGKTYFIFLPVANGDKTLLLVKLKFSATKNSTLINCNMSIANMTKTKFPEFTWKFGHCDEDFYITGKVINFNDTDKVSDFIEDKDMIVFSIPQQKMILEGSIIRLMRTSQLCALLSSQNSDGYWFASCPVLTDLFVVNSIDNVDRVDSVCILCPSDANVSEEPLACTMCKKHSSMINLISTEFKQFSTNEQFNSENKIIGTALAMCILRESFSHPTFLPRWEKAQEKAREFFSIEGKKHGISKKKSSLKTLLEKKRNTRNISHVMNATRNFFKI